MKKKAINNILFFLLVICFISLCFLQNNNNTITRKVVFNDDEPQYLQVEDVYEKINIDFENLYSVKDITVKELKMLTKFGIISYDGGTRCR